MAPVISLLVIVTLSIIITRIASVALAHTGLSRQSAKFQARSAFTGVGFTTSESEKVVNHPVRRKILMLLMLLGNAGIVDHEAAVSEQKQVKEKEKKSDPGDKQGLPPSANNELD